MSYYSDERHDDNGEPILDNIRLLFKRAKIFGTKIGLHLEPYDGRTALSVVDDIKVSCSF